MQSRVVIEREGGAIDVEATVVPELVAAGLTAEELVELLEGGLVGVVEEGLAGTVGLAGTS